MSRAAMIGAAAVLVLAVGGGAAYRVYRAPLGGGDALGDLAS